MKTLQLLCLGLGLFSLTAFSWNTLLSWNIDEDYEIRFRGSGASGTFRGLAGIINFDENNLSAAKMNVTVDVNTIETGNKTKNKHAKGKNWFDAEKYPTISFQSQQLRQVDKGYEVEGQLTIHGVTQTVTIPFDFKREGNGAVFAGSITVNRKDYGVNGNFFAFTVAKELAVDIRVPVTE